MSRIAVYKKQVEIQKVELLLPVIINNEKEYKVEKMLNKKYIRGKLKYLVQ